MYTTFYGRSCKVVNESSTRAQIGLQHPTEGYFEMWVDKTEIEGLQEAPAESLQSFECVACGDSGYSEQESQCVACSDRGISSTDFVLSS